MTSPGLVALMVIGICLMAVFVVVMRLSRVNTPRSLHDPSNPTSFTCPRCSSPMQPGYMHGRGFAWSTSTNALQIFGVQVLSRRAVITAWRCEQCGMVLVDTAS